jgi:glycosidase
MPSFFLCHKFSKFLLAVFCISVISGVKAQHIKIEPMNWWVGMNNPSLQLMVHAAGAGEMIPSLNYPGVTIIKIHKADSKNYLFIDLLVSKNTKPGCFPIHFKKEGKVVYTFSYEILQRKPDASRTKGFSSADVIYLITPDRFANGDADNDVVGTMRENRIDRKNDYGRHGGDIRGIINSLDYIAGMGFTAIWPTPLLENDMKESSYHGYAITDYYKVDPRFGTLEEYKELADKCRQKGLKLVFDGVVNHTGSQYWWMNDLPFKNWINYPDSHRITNHRRTVNQDLYAAESDKELMVRGWFVETMPDLNQSNPFLTEFLIQNTIWWIETLSLGGIRQDTYPYSQKKFLEQWSCRIMNEYPLFSITGEEWSTNPLIAAYWQKGKTNTTGYSGCLKSPMDFPLQQALWQSLTEPEAWDKGIVKLYEALANDFVYANPKDLLVFGDNHDMNRILTFLNNDVDLLQMAMTYILTIRGIPQVYYGTEVLMENSAKPGDHGLIRSDFPGGWQGDRSSAFTGDGLSADQLRIQAYLKKLLNWRKDKKVIHEGSTLHFAPYNGVYVYFRYTRQEKVMVVLNKNDKQTQLTTSRFNELLKGYKQAFNVLTGEQFSLQEMITLPAKSATVWEIR